MIGTRYLQQDRSVKAFTLLELLVVVTIIGVMAGLAIPAFTNVRKGMDVATATDQVSSLLSLARQYAMTENAVHEVRFLKFADDDLPVTELSYRGAGIWKIDPLSGQSVAVDAISRFPGTVVAAEEAKVSTLITKGQRGALSKEKVAGSSGATYRACGFLPDGSTTFEDISEKYFVTLWDENGLEGRDGVKKNFATIQVDPVSGGLQIYRPE